VFRVTLSLKSKKNCYIACRKTPKIVTKITQSAIAAAQKRLDKKKLAPQWSKPAKFRAPKGLAGQTNEGT
jgi:hypothetical protein